jgi:hypothetical protein
MAFICREPYDADRLLQPAGAREPATHHEVAMADISNIKGLLDWKLLTGSHEWPGPDGGTCINEAAIVAAGFQYQPVGGPEDFPPCFSRELGLLLLSLNDALSDERRQKLMRFVLRLPGSKDAARVERRRCRLLRDAISALLAGYGLPLDSMSSQLRCLDDRTAFAGQAGEAIGAAAEHHLPAETADIFLDAALDILAQAFAIGRQARPSDAALIEARLATARQLQPA